MYISPNTLTSYQPESDENGRVSSQGPAPRSELKAPRQSRDLILTAVLGELGKSHPFHSLKNGGSGRPPVPHPGSGRAQGPRQR